MINKEITISLNSDLLSISISLAGFVLAILTIIVTFKDSLNNKKAHIRAKSPDLFFQSKHYFSTVKILHGASLILLIIFFLSSLMKIGSESIDDELFDYIVLGNLLLILTTTLRTLFLLYQIVKIQTQDDKNLSSNHSTQETRTK